MNASAGRRVGVVMTAEGRHGRSTYANQGCRCPLCTDAEVRYQAHVRALRFAERVEVDGRLFAPRATSHGNSTYRNWGCRCLVCSTAAADAARARNKTRRVSPPGEATS
jgi:hypothetical protein